jgi:hypothetical protein
LNDKASESSRRIQLALPGPRPTAGAEDALHELERLLQSLDAGRSIPGAEVEPQAPGPAEAMTQAGPRRRALKPVMLGLIAAAVAAVFALSFTPGLSRWPLAIAPASAPMAMPPPSDETVAGLSNSGSPLLKNGADLEGAKVAESVGAPESPSGTASFDDVPPASPPAKSSPSGDGLGTSAEAPPQSEAFNPNPDRTASLPSGPAPIATPASSAAPQDAPSASAWVKVPAGLLPKAAGGPAAVEQRPEPEPSATQSDNPSGVGEAAKPNAISLDTAPLPPIRPVSFGVPAKREKTAKPHRIAQAVQAAPEPLAPLPAMPKAGAAQPLGNPLLRLFHDTFK